MGKVFDSLWHNLYAIGQIFIAENGQILKIQIGHLVTLVRNDKNVVCFWPQVTGPNAKGYNFISGGGGIILNRKIALRLNQECSCPNTDPTDRMDDVQLGACIHNIGVPIVHSERAHQVR